MNTMIANSILARFPDLLITEDFMSHGSYWVNVQVGNQWLVIQKTAGDEIGMSVVQNGIVDLGGHDHVLNSISEATDFAIELIEKLSVK